MRKLVLQMSVSIDGYVGGGPKDQEAATAEHPDVTALKLAWLRDVGVHIMGRVTYEAMAGYWPTGGDADGDGVYAELMNNTPKVVFSRSLTSADWPESRIAGGDTVDEVAKLKGEPGGDIMVHGGASFVQALSRLRLIDEYRLVIEPVALGSGMPMFDDLAVPLRLELVDSRPFPDGTVVNVYRPR